MPEKKEYIEREAVLLKIMQNGTDAVTVETVLHFPAAEVAPVVYGRWVWQTSDLYMCTACKADCHVEECMNEPQYTYCPNCGAKMDGGETNET